MPPIPPILLQKILVNLQALAVRICKIVIKSSPAWPLVHPAPGSFSSDLPPHLENSVRSSPALGSSRGLGACCSRPPNPGSSIQDKMRMVKEVSHLQQIEMVMLTWVYRYCCCCCRTGYSAAKAGAVWQTDLAVLMRQHLEWHLHWAKVVVEPLQYLKNDWLQC